MQREYEILTPESPEQIAHLRESLGINRRIAARLRKTAVGKEDPSRTNLLSQADVYAGTAKGIIKALRRAK